MSDNAKLLYNRGLEKGKVGDYDGAIADFSAAIELDNTCCDFFILRGQNRRLTGRLDDTLEAYSDYLKATELCPLNAEAWVGLGTLQMQLSPNDPVGLENLEKAATIDPSTISHWNIGTGKLHQGDYRGMICSFDLFIKDNTSPLDMLGDAYYFKGIGFFHLKEFENAIDNFTLAITHKASINYLEAFFNRATAYNLINEVEKSLEDYTKVLALKPDNIEALFNRSELFYRLQNVELALKDLRTALTLDENNIEILKQLGEYLIFNDGFDEATTAYTKLISLQPQVSDHYFNRGICHLQKKRYAATIDDYNQCLKIEPAVAQAYYYRGIAHFYLNNDQACNDWKESHKLGCEDAKPWMEKHCTFKEELGLDFGNGLWISLDNIAKRP